MRRDQFPSQLREFYFDFDLDNRKLWGLDVPVETLPISDLEWHLDLPIWTTIRGQPLFDLAPNDVLRQLDSYPFHRGKLEQCDTSFPIDVMWSEDRFVILDGIHRLARLKMKGASEVKVRKIPRDMIPLIEK